ncbi:hypothetical protein L596_007666 [Steinernema carpocapsae]|uniref:Uncharacterized protein n=1 Tax=Steinernema carpocapsae TaxID=34508 RepID=A0A4U5PAM6_STECR|nr:hypothetical protein L596_007666 [Steinernema carpocapsae]
MSSQSYAHVGNGVQAASQNQMYIPMPINPAGHSSSYTAPHPPHFNQAPPAALYTPQQPVPRFIPPVIPSTYRPSPPKPHFDQHRTQHHAAPSSQSRPPKPLPAGNANAIPLGAPRFGGPSNQAWRQRMNESSEAGYPNRKRGFHGDAGGRRHSNEHDRSIDDRRHSTGGRRF